MADESLDLWIERLNRGDAAAVERFFHAYEPYLRIAVRRRLGTRLRSKVDSADIVQSVFADVLGGLREGGWRFEGQPQLLAFLRQIAWRRIADRAAKYRPALEKEQGLGETHPDDLPRSTQPRPSEEAQGHEFWERVLRTCPPSHHEIVRMRRDGMRLEEIARRAGLHEGSVRRILYDLARRMSIARRGAGGPPVDEIS